MSGILQPTIQAVEKDGLFTRQWYKAIVDGLRSINDLQIVTTVKNANATTRISDRRWYHSDGSAYTWTIDSNANVPYPIDTELEFLCKAAAAVNVTLAIATDTLVWLPTGGTGSRMLGQYARARALKVAPTIWMLDGVGIT